LNFVPSDEGDGMFASRRSAASGKVVRFTLIEMLESRRFLSVAPLGSPVEFHHAAWSEAVPPPGSAGCLPERRIADRSSMIAASDGIRGGFHAFPEHRELRLRPTIPDLLVVVVYNAVPGEHVDSVVVIAPPPKIGMQVGHVEQRFEGDDASLPQHEPLSPSARGPDHRPDASDHTPDARPPMRPDALRPAPDINGPSSPPSAPVAEAAVRIDGSAASANRIATGDQVALSIAKTSDVPASTRSARSANQVRVSADSENSHSIAVTTVRASPETATGVPITAPVALSKAAAFFAGPAQLAVRTTSFLADLPLSITPPAVPELPEVADPGAGSVGMVAQGTLLGLFPWQMPRVQDSQEWAWWEATAAGSLLVAATGFYYCRMVTLDRLERQRAERAKQREQHSVRPSALP
jgi:hypothetical protein